MDIAIKYAYHHFCSAKTFVEHYKIWICRIHMPELSDHILLFEKEYVVRNITKITF